MKFYRYGEFCLCPAGGQLPPGAVVCERQFAPLVFLVQRDPAHSRGVYPITSYAELNELEGCGLLQAPASQQPHALDGWLAAHGACVLNTAFVRCFDVLRRWYRPKREKLRINLVGLGDVGGTVLTGLKLLGHEIMQIGIYDPNEPLCRRYCMELNQILPERDDAPRGAVVLRNQEELFDCDLFLFAASVQIPQHVDEHTDVRMAQYAKNRAMLREYAALARETGFTGLFCQIADPVDHLCRAIFLDSNRTPDGAQDWQGLLPEQVCGFGLGVMRARAEYLAAQEKIDFTRGFVCGPHGAGLIVANAPDEDYDDVCSRALTQKVVQANLAVRALGYKPYIAPGLSSGCISILRMLRGQTFECSINLGGAWFGCSVQMTPFGAKPRRTALHPALRARIEQSYRALREFDYDG